MIKDDKKIDLQKILDEIEKANAEADNFLAGLDKRMAEADLEYAKLLVQENIDTLKIAKGILKQKAV